LPLKKDTFCETRDRAPATPQNTQNSLSKVSLDSCLSKARYPNGLREIATGDKAKQDQARLAAKKAEAAPERQAERAAQMANLNWTPLVGPWGINFKV